MSETQTLTTVSSDTCINVKNLNEEKTCRIKCAECLSYRKKSRVFKSEMAYVRHVNGHDIPDLYKKQLIRFGRTYVQMIKRGMIA